jgi:hypothetical protein
MSRKSSTKMLGDFFSIISVRMCADPLNGPGITVNKIQIFPPGPRSLHCDYLFWSPPRRRWSGLRYTAKKDINTCNIIQIYLSILGLDENFYLHVLDFLHSKGSLSLSILIYISAT